MSPSPVRCVIEPNVDECRTLPIGPEFSRCLVEIAECKYAIFLRDKFFCNHPDHHDFTTETA
jgi:hypothetical protein